MRGAIDGEALITINRTVGLEISMREEEMAANCVVGIDTGAVFPGVR